MSAINLVDELGVTEVLNAKDNKDTDQSSILYTPHDAVFKSCMENLEVAREVLERNLPLELSSKIDFNTLKEGKDTFLGKDFKRHNADVLYEFYFVDDPQELGLVLYHVEHQSTAEYWMPLRMVQYLFQILEHYRKQHPDAEKLPVIIPLIYYTGSQSYNYSTDLFSLFNKPNIARKFLMSPYPLTDLSKMPDEEIIKHTFSGFFEYVMKHIHDKTLDGFDLFAQAQHLIIRLFELGEKVQKIDLKDYVDAVLFYVFKIKIRYMTQEEFIKKAQSVLSEPFKGEAMNFADYLEQTGMQRGMQIGIEQGKEQGKEQGLHQGLELAAKNMLAKGLSVDLIHQITGLTVTQILQLQKDQEIQ